MDRPVCVCASQTIKPCNGDDHAERRKISIYIAFKLPK